MCEKKSPLNFGICIKRYNTRNMGRIQQNCVELLLVLPWHWMMFQDIRLMVEVAFTLT
jgi:hypothetical protein